MLHTSRILTAGEVAALKAMAPTCFEVVADADRLLLSFRSPSPTGRRKALFTYEILPAGDQGFAGDVLGQVVEDLTATVLRLHREAGESSEGGTVGRILKVINGASHAVTQRHLRGGELRILTAEIHSLDEEEWFE